MAKMGLEGSERGCLSFRRGSQRALQLVALRRPLRGAPATLLSWAAQGMPAAAPLELSRPRCRASFSAEGGRNEPVAFRVQSKGGPGQRHATAFPSQPVWLRTACTLAACLTPAVQGGGLSQSCLAMLPRTAPGPFCVQDVPPSGLEVLRLAHHRSSLSAARLETELCAACHSASPGHHPAPRDAPVQPPRRSGQQHQPLSGNTASVLFSAPFFSQIQGVKGGCAGRTGQLWGVFGSVSRSYFLRLFLPPVLLSFFGSSFAVQCGLELCPRCQTRSRNMLNGISSVLLAVSGPSPVLSPCLRITVALVKE